MTKNKRKKTARGERSRTVFVGMSGGVDSAVSAAILQKQGYDVVGVFIRTWHPDFLECNEEEERRDAMRVCAHLDIPFLTFDFEDVYKKEVADYMIREYKAGRTPNPDVMCNKEVKFGAFLKKSLSMGADFVATGHYAQASQFCNFSVLLQPSAGTFHVQNFGPAVPEKKNKSSFLNGLAECNREEDRGPEKKKLSFLLSKGIDPSKDQSYFLWILNQKQLSKILFPVGHLKKTEVRKLAKKFNLPVAEKKDSQGICFLGAVDLKDFLKHYIKEKRGEVQNEKGEIVGFHNGVVFHTLGERHGFTITKKSSKDKPYYIVDKDVKKNILYVSQKISPCQGGVPKGRGGLKLMHTNWISEIPKSDKNYTCQIRYHGELLDCKVNCTGLTCAEIIFDKNVLVDKGQSVVVYDKNVCFGGGVVV